MNIYLICTIKHNKYELFLWLIFFKWMSYYYYYYCKNAISLKIGRFATKCLNLNYFHKRYFLNKRFFCINMLLFSHRFPPKNRDKKKWPKTWPSEKKSDQNIHMIHIYMYTTSHKYTYHCVLHWNLKISDIMQVVYL